MARASYSVQTGAAVPLVAATAKTVLGVKSNAAFGLELYYRSITCDGVSASAVPILVEVCYATWATNSPGTASTTVTPVQQGGRAMTHGMTAARAWSTEPTVLTVLHEELIPPTSGVMLFRPFSAEYDCALAEGFAIRCTAPVAVNVRASMDLWRV